MIHSENKLINACASVFSERIIAVYCEFSPRQPKCLKGVNGRGFAWHFLLETSLIKFNSSVAKTNLIKFNQILPWSICIKLYLVKYENFTCIIPQATDDVLPERRLSLHVLVMDDTAKRSG